MAHDAYNAPVQGSLMAHTITISRREFHQRLWEKPIHAIAKDLGVHQWRLWQATKDFDVPSPPSGSWTRVRTGRQLPPQPLGGDPDEVVTLRMGFDRTIRFTPEAERRGTEWEIKVSDGRRDTRIRTLEAQAKAWPGRLSRYEALAARRASHLKGMPKPLLTRAVSILAALVDAFERRGYAVELYESAVVSVAIKDVGLSFWVRERLKRIDGEPREPLRYDHGFSGTGKLTIMYVVPHAFPQVRHFPGAPESDARPLEARLKDFVGHLEAIAERTKEHERQVEENRIEAARRERLQQQRDEEHRLRQSRQRKHRDRLDHWIASLDRSVHLVHYAHAAELLLKELHNLELRNPASAKRVRWAKLAIARHYSRAALAGQLIEQLQQRPPAAASRSDASGPPSRVPYSKPWHPNRGWWDR